MPAPRASEQLSQSTCAREDARLALEANPLVGPRIGDVGPLLDALLEANRSYLPQFAAG